MTSAPRIQRVGTRGSRLALLQTQSVLSQFAAMLPDVRWETVAFSTPGDRDQTTELRSSPADFFTRDLDQAVRERALDCALHSAKDIPDPIGDGLDWFWLPWRADARDTLVCPRGGDMGSMPDEGRIGVSSARREAYCRARFPKARLVPVRGSIEERLRQLDQGTFDLLIMAGAALMRLGLEERVSEWIPVRDLPPPDGQGALAITFRDGDSWFHRLRRRYVNAVTFAAAGAGAAGACTLDGLRALERCDVVLHDTLFGRDLLDRLPAGVRRIDVGKRCGRHGKTQPETNALIARYARQGLRVVRLKGGDPGLFGRLAEEIEALETLDLPYRVLPGVTSLSSATTGTGMLLTRRGVARGFTVITPREAGGAVASVAAAARRELPLVFFMALAVARQVTADLLAEGKPPTTPAAVVYGAGSDQSRILSGTLADIADRIRDAACEMPGVLIVGDAARHRYHRGGALDGRRVLLTASDALQDKAAGLVWDYGGEPVCRPLIRMRTTDDALARIGQLQRYDYVVLTSPSAVHCFAGVLATAEYDLRRVPNLITCGGATSRALRGIGLRADIEPAAGFGAEGLLAAVTRLITAEHRVLRLRSDKAGPALATALRASGARVDDCVLYRNEPVTYTHVPAFDAAFFASASAVEAYASQWGMASLAGRVVVAIGKPTLAALEHRGVPADVVPVEATVEASLDALATFITRQALI